MAAEYVVTCARVGLFMLTASMRDASVGPAGAAEAGAETTTPAKSAATHAATVTITRTIGPQGRVKRGADAPR